MQLVRMRLPCTLCDISYCFPNDISTNDVSNDGSTNDGTGNILGLRRARHGETGHK